MKLHVFYNPKGINEPEGWYKIGCIPVKNETEAREKAEKLKDGNTKFAIEI